MALHGRFPKSKIFITEVISKVAALLFLLNFFLVHCDAQSNTSGPVPISVFDFSKFETLNVSNSATVSNTDLLVVLPFPAALGFATVSTPFVLLKGPGGDSVYGTCKSSYYFSTAFSFRLNSTSGDASGFVFMLNPVPYGSGRIGGEFNWAFDISQISPNSLPSFSVEYDSFATPTCNDVDSNHIGVNTNWTCNSEATVEVSHIAQLDSGKDLWSWIDYDSGSTRLSVYLSDNNNKPSTPVLNKSIDLCYVLTGINNTISTPSFYPGFAGAGRDTSGEQLRVCGWSFETQATGLPNISTPMGCTDKEKLFGGGSVPPPSHPPPSPSPSPGSRSNIPLIVGVVSGVAALVLLSIIACVCYRRHRARSFVRKPDMAGSTLSNIDTDIMPFRGEDVPHGNHNKRVDFY